MKKIAYILLTFTLFTCSQEKKETENAEKKELGNFKKTEALPNCSCSDLEKDSTGTVSLLNKELFTGICYSYYPNDSSKVMEEIQYLDGKIHGYYKVYSPSDGSVLTEDQYIAGKKQSSGDIYRCNCDDLKVEKIGAEKLNTYTLLGKKFTGICEKFSKDSKFKIMDMEFVDGLLEGNSIYYDQYGDPITADVYSKGKMIKTIVYTKD